MPRFEPYVVIHSLGAPLIGDDQTTFTDFLDFLSQEGVSFSWGHIENDPVQVFNVGYRGQRSEEGRELFGDAHLDTNVTFPNLPVRGAELWLGTWNKEQTRSVRMNIFGNDGIAPKNFDALSEHLTKLALAVHQKLGAMTTVIESSERALAPYNTKTMPLWAGWYTVYGKAVQKKYGLSGSTLFPSGISATTTGADLVVRHTVPFSEHILRGWDANQQAFWTGMKGKLLRKPGRYVLPPKDGETYIVDAVDEKSGAMLLKPYSDS